MRVSVLDFLVCPSCSGKLRLGGTTADAAEVTTGELLCVDCGLDYPVADGVPRLVSARERDSHVAASFGFEWQTFHDGGFESDTVFGRTIDEDVAQFHDVFDIKAAEPGAAGRRDPLDGLVVADIGCGSGKLTVELARRHPGATFLAVDVNPAITEVAKAAADLPNLHVVQGSVFALPVREQSVDRLWCNGVIHHTGATEIAFTGLTRLVAQDGELFVWVYQRKVSPLVLVRDLLRPLGLHTWSHRTVYRICRALSLPTLIAVRLLNTIAGLPVLRSLVERSTHARILTRRRNYDELALTWFDVLSPRYRDTYTVEQVESWYTHSGFEPVRRYWWPVGVTGRRTKPLR
ncbi:methyltransferase domain-containing protein [Actinokineospora globicatena]|uniref:Methyltransferase n=1 Tax=Actinokineospora globicatena TaxID=103729 RepID=A0A9W6QUB3_9PSEU|nr:methyltransferase domain-containing protein [Actinokineospora globicatena]GLW95158.1 methyltransferase [Actinokineospora globicatena]